MAGRKKAEQETGAALQQAQGGGRVKSVGLQWRIAGRSSQAGVDASSSTRMMRAAVTATGATAWRTMQRGQWSASDSSGWVWATWATVRSASRARHRTAAANLTFGWAKTDLLRACLNLPRAILRLLRIH